VKIDSISKSPRVFIFGLFLVFSISACQAVKTPSETTQAFWSAMAKDDLEQAKKFCTSQSKPLLVSSQENKLKNASFSYGKIVIDGNQASVETQLIEPSKKSSIFTTFLIKEDEHWKVDYQRSVNNNSGDIFKEIIKSLNNLGETFNKQLEQKIPLIEKEIESFGKELKQQIDNIENQLDKSYPQKKKNPYQDTI
jgi:hypothetical protein